MHLMWTRRLFKPGPLPVATKLTFHICVWERPPPVKQLQGIFFISAAGALCGSFVETTMIQVEGRGISAGYRKLLVPLVISEFNPSHQFHCTVWYSSACGLLSEPDSVQGGKATFSSVSPPFTRRSLDQILRQCQFQDGKCKSSWGWKIRSRRLIQEVCSTIFSVHNIDKYLIFT